jgi:hypothetical protein
LLKHIKKASQIDAATKEDVDRLKQEVSYLRSMVESMASQLQQLTGGQEITIDETQPLLLSNNKKRKIEEPRGPPIPDVNTSTSMPPLPPPPSSMSYVPVRQHHHHHHHQQPNFDQTEMLTDQDLLVEDIPLDMGYQSGTVTPPTTEKVQRLRSADILESMFDFVKEDDNLNDHPPKPDASHSSSSAFNRSVSTENAQPVAATTQLDPKLAAKLNNAVANLPPSLQESFVERMVSQIASPDAYKKHCDAVGVLATAAAIEAQNQTMRSNNAAARADVPGSDGTNRHQSDKQLSMNNQSEMTLPVAAAALGAFLSKYGNAANNSNPSGGEVYEPVKQ